MTSWTSDIAADIARCRNAAGLPAESDVVVTERGEPTRYYYEEDGDIYDVPWWVSTVPSPYLIAASVLVHGREFCVGLVVVKDENGWCPEGLAYALDPKNILEHQTSADIIEGWGPYLRDRIVEEVMRGVA